MHAEIITIVINLGKNYSTIHKVVEEEPNMVHGDICYNHIILESKVGGSRVQSLSLVTQ